MTDWNDYGFDTRAVRAGQHRTNLGEQGEPIFTTSSWVFENAAQAAARFAGTEPGNVYSRFNNPTVQAFEERLAALEGGERCVATASGMAAIFCTCVGLLKSGDHIVSSRSLFGSTTALFDNYLTKFGITISYVDLTDLPAWEAVIRPDTRLLYVETPSNPLTEVGDLAALASIAHARGALLAVDNTFCTPALQRPLELGADLVIHSGTKYLDGQGRCLGGAVVGRNKEVEQVFGVVRTAGPCLSPFNAWVLLKGLETLRLRMTAQCANALAVAQWLEGQPGVTRVFYPGLPSHPQHALAARQQSGSGAMIGFEVEGGREGAWRVIDNTRLISITGNLGDVKSTITHPATTTHGKLSPAQREAAGIREGLIRLSVGLEEPADLQADLARGLPG